MHDAIPILSVRTSQMDNVRIQYLAVLLVESNPLGHQFPGLFRVIEAGTTIASLHTGTEQVTQPCLIMRQVFVQRFNSGSRSTTVILGEGNEHKAHAGRFLPGTIVDILPFDNFLVGPWQGPVGFNIPHRSFVGTHQKIPIRDIQIDTFCPAPLIERADPIPLFPLRIQISFVPTVDSRGTGITGIGTVVLEYVHTGRMEEVLQTLEIITTPI